MAFFDYPEDDAAPVVLKAMVVPAVWEAEAFVDYLASCYRLCITPMHPSSSPDRSRNTDRYSHPRPRTPTDRVA
jgi:hypothetical protein